VVGSAPWAQALTVTGNTISYVGDEAGAMALAGPDTRVVDLDGRHRAGVVAQFSANRMSADPDTVQNLAARYGSPRKDLFFRPQMVLKSGGRISMGTDWPAAGYFSTYRPLDSPADQRLSVAEAVHANTLGAADGEIRREV
jgi:predicted amidohydrolase YtcJ